MIIRDFFYKHQKKSYQPQTVYLQITFGLRHETCILQEWLDSDVSTSLYCTAGYLNCVRFNE